MTFEIDHIWKNGEEVANYSTILVPGDTIIIEYTATAASSGEEWPDVYIKIASGDSSEYYLASLPALGSGQTKSSGSITIDSFPTLYSDTHEVTFSYAISVENAENEDNAITDQGDPLKTFTNYVYPLSVIDNASKIVRCANDYTESISGTKALVQRLALFLQSGNLSDITSMELQIMKSTDDEDYDAGIIDISNYKSTIFEDGYSDSVQDSLFLLDSLNNSNFFKDYRYSYNFNIVFNYNSIGTSRSETYSITPLDYTLTGLTLTQAHAALQLVGQTELGTGEFVYGGVAIGHLHGVVPIAVEQQRERGAAYVFGTQRTQAAGLDSDVVDPTGRGVGLERALQAERYTASLPAVSAKVYLEVLPPQGLVYMQRVERLEGTRLTQRVDADAHLDTCRCRSGEEPEAEHRSVEAVHIELRRYHHAVVAARQGAGVHDE